MSTLIDKRKMIRNHDLNLAPHQFSTVDNREEAINKNIYDSQRMIEIPQDFINNESSRAPGVNLPQINSRQISQEQQSIRRSASYAGKQKCKFIFMNFS